MTSVSMTETPKAYTPTFTGMVRGELHKALHNRGVVISGIAISAVAMLNMLVYYFVVSSLSTPVPSGPNGAVDVFSPESIIYSLMTLNLSNVRTYSGLFIMIAAVIIIALEYQQGTIRVLLARGVGRVRLLGAKLTAIAILGMVGLAGIFALSSIITYLDLVLADQTRLLDYLPSFFWPDTLTYLWANVINIVATFSLAAFFAVLGRSLAPGLIFTIGWWFVETIAQPILALISALTGNDAWVNTLNFFLGTNLTRMADLVTPDRNDLVGRALRLASGGGASLASSIDGAHTLLVTFVYTVAFLGVAFYLVQKRDVLQ